MSNARLFGTDGVRGLANGKITAELALSLSESAARVLVHTGDANSINARAIVGRDTRVSGEFISSAVCAGLASAGIDVIDVGILPTPAIAYLTAKLGVSLGVVISASHNAMPDNGIKFFANDGYKLPDEVENQIEGLLGTQWERPLGEHVGRITGDHSGAKHSYEQYLAQSIGGSIDATHNAECLPLQGLKVVLDGANGAASEVAPEVLRACGATVTVINASPDGYNINDKCGSTHPEQLQALVKASDADLGVAFDGDADRLIAVDERGELIDGDKVITILALDLKEQGKLKDNTVVLTVMSNLGTKIALEKAGIDIEITDVGDRYVLERMLEKSLILGGEQSGHIINSNYSTTGDGTLSALLLTDVLMRSRKANPELKISELANIVKTLPQVLINVKDVDKAKLDQDTVIRDFVAGVEFEFAGTGRVLLRSSGTEPLIRVMVEAKTQELAESKAQAIADLVKERLSI